MVQEELVDTRFRSAIGQISNFMHLSRSMIGQMLFRKF